MEVPIQYHERVVALCEGASIVCVPYHGGFSVRSVCGQKPRLPVTISRRGGVVAAPKHEGEEAVIIPIEVLLNT